MKQKSKILIAEQKETLKMKRTARIISESEYQKQIHLLEADTATIAANFTKAYEAGPAEMRAYLDGPEGSSEEARALLQKQAADNDGDASDDKISIGKGGGAAMDYTPTQNEIDLMSSMSYPLGSAKTLIQAINNPTAAGIVTSGEFIIDGHHRWSGAIGIGGSDAKVDSTDIQWPGKDTAQILAAAQLTIAAKLGGTQPTPSQGAKFDTNILDKGADVIAKMIIDNVGQKTDAGAPGALLNDDMMEKLCNSPNFAPTKIVLEWLGMKAAKKGNNKGPEDGYINFGTNYDDDKESAQTTINQMRQAIAQKVAENLAALPKNDNAPVRADMPQFDPKVKGPKASTVIGDLGAGNFNVTPPFAKESKNHILNDLESILQESITTWKNHRRK